MNSELNQGILDQEEDIYQIFEGLEKAQRKEEEVKEI